MSVLIKELALQNFLSYGEKVCLPLHDLNIFIGANGSGKSTLLNIIGGIDTLDEGRVGINGEFIEEMSEKNRIAYRRKNLGYVFQSYNLIPNLTVRENIEVGAYLSKNHLDIEQLIDVLGLKKHENKIL